MIESPNWKSGDRAFDNKKFENDAILKLGNWRQQRTNKSNVWRIICNATKDLLKIML